MSASKIHIRKHLQQKTGSAQAAIADAGARRIAMHILRDLTVERFFSSRNDALKQAMPGG